MSPPLPQLSPLGRRLPLGGRPKTLGTDPEAAGAATLCPEAHAAAPNPTLAHASRAGAHGFELECSRELF